jgi:hypothetical protein
VTDGYIVVDGSSKESIKVARVVQDALSCPAMEQEWSEEGNDDVEEALPFQLCVV